MGVSGVTKSGGVVCRWFDGNTLREAKFVPETLSPVEPPQHKGAKSHRAEAKANRAVVA